MIDAGKGIQINFNSSNMSFENYKALGEEVGEEITVNVRYNQPPFIVRVQGLCDFTEWQGIEINTMQYAEVVATFFCKMGYEVTILCIKEGE